MNAEQILEELKIIDRQLRALTAAVKSMAKTEEPPASYTEIIGTLYQPEDRDPYHNHP